MAHVEPLRGRRRDEGFLAGLRTLDGLLADGHGREPVRVARHPGHDERGPQLRCDEFCSSPGELSEARLRLYG